METAYVAFLFLQHPADLHEAAGVIGDDRVGTGLQDRGAFYLVHRSRDWGVFHGKGPAEAATGLGLAHLDQFQSLNISQKGAWFILDSQLT